jgi:hypothetical protein
VLVFWCDVLIHLEVEDTASRAADRALSRVGVGKPSLPMNLRYLVLCVSSDGGHGERPVAFL